MKLIKRTVAFLLLAAILTLLLASCTAERAYPGAPEGMRPCNEGDEGVIMYVPSNWSVDTSTGIPTAYFSYTDSTMINMVTVDSTVIGSKSVPEYFEEYKANFSSTVKDFELTVYNKETGTEYAYYENISKNINMYEYRYSFKVSKGADNVTKYCFAQAFFRISADSDLYIITYGTTEAKFDTHLADLEKVYTNLKIVTEPIPMIKDELPKPEFTADKAPEGYSALTGEHVDYVLYVPSSWTPQINTGLTAASKGDNPSTTCTVTAFTLQDNNGIIDGADYDSFFDGLLKSLTDSFGEVRFDDTESKYIKVAFADKKDLNSPTATRKYVYKVTVSGTEYVYEQYVTIRNGYVYLLTFCCKTADYAANTDTFGGIVSNFKFKA